MIDPGRLGHMSILKSWDWAGNGPVGHVNLTRLVGSSVSGLVWEGTQRRQGCKSQGKTERECTVSCHLTMR